MSRFNETPFYLKFSGRLPLDPASAPEAWPSSTIGLPPDLPESQSAAEPRSAPSVQSFSVATLQPLSSVPTLPGSQEQTLAGLQPTPPPVPSPAVLQQPPAQPTEEFRPSVCLRISECALLQAVHLPSLVQFLLRCLPPYHC